MFDRSSTIKFFGIMATLLVSACNQSALPAADGGLPPDQQLWNMDASASVDAIGNESFNAVFSTSCESSILGTIRILPGSDCSTGGPKECPKTGSVLIIETTADPGARTIVFASDGGTSSSQGRYYEYSGVRLSYGSNIFSGTVTLAGLSSSSALLTGSYDLTLSTGRRIQGEFTALHCDPFCAPCDGRGCGAAVCDFENCVTQCSCGGTSEKSTCAVTDGGAWECSCFSTSGGTSSCAMPGDAGCVPNCCS